MTPPVRPTEKRQPAGPYSLALRNDDTGDVIMDLHGIPEHVVSQIALLLGKAMPMARAAQAGLAAVRALQDVGAALSGAMADLGVSQPARRRVRGRR